MPNSLPTASVTIASSSTTYTTTAGFSYSTLGAIGIGSSGSYLTSNGNVTINTAAGANGSSWYTGPVSPGLHVKDNATFEGDITWKGRNLGKLLESIEDRLAILADPDPVKLEKFAALKKAYDHYKLMEKLIGEE